MQAYDTGFEIIIDLQLMPCLLFSCSIKLEFMAVKCLVFVGFLTCRYIFDNEFSETFRI